MGLVSYFAYPEPRPSIEIEVIRPLQSTITCKPLLSLARCDSLKRFEPLVPACLGQSRQQYLIVAGLVFTPFVEPFVYDFDPPQPGRRR